MSCGAAPADDDVGGEGVVDTPIFFLKRQKRSLFSQKTARRVILSHLLRDSSSSCSFLASSSSMTAAREKGACGGVGVPHGLVLLLGVVGFLGTGLLGGDSVFKPDSMLSSKKVAVNVAFLGIYLWLNDASFLKFIP